MKTGWENDGNADANGQFAAFIDMEDGSGVQRFIGATQKDVADNLLIAQGNATKKIRDYTRNESPDMAKPATEVKARVLTADERFRIANDITDPAKLPEAIKTVIEAETGVPLATIREEHATKARNNEAEEAKRVAKEWAAETPEYYVCNYNAQTMANYMVRMGYAWTKKNFGIAFEQLKEAGLVAMKPAPSATEDPENPPQPANDEQPNNGGLPAPAIKTRPREVVHSTGIRNGDSNAQPALRTITKKLTIQEIEAMPKAEYRNKLNDPAFEKAVEEAYANSR